jgi:hypothetical protein
MQDWTFQKTISPAETFTVDYRLKVGNSYVTMTDQVDFVSESEVYTSYTAMQYIDKDGKNQSQDVVTSTISTTTTCVGAANPTRWKSKLEAGSPAFPGTTLVKGTESFNKYIITQDGPVETEVVTNEYEPWIAFAGGLAIDNYKNIDLGVENVLVRQTIVQKEENKAADLSKQTTIVYQAWGATSAGKTVASTIMAALKRSSEEDRISGTYTLVERMASLVCNGIEKTINIGRGSAPSLPTKLDQQNEKLIRIQDTVNTNNGWDVSSPAGYSYKKQSTDLSYGSLGVSNTGSYYMKFAPDSYLRPATDAGDNGTGLNYIWVSSSAAAYVYGRAVYYIFAGMANGKSLTTELRNIPSEPMGTLYLEAAGTVGRFRANGTTFAFDSEGLIVGCDAILDGGAGLVASATGADWFPMMVPAVNLPTVTPAGNNDPALANTITAPGGFDPMAPGSIWSSFGTTGVEGDVYAMDLTRASVVAAAAENVRRESVSRSLGWLLDAPYDVTPATVALTSVAVSRGFAVSGSGIIPNLSKVTFTFPGSGSGVIATLSEVPENKLFVGSGSGLISTVLMGPNRASGVVAPLLGASPTTSFTGWDMIVNANQDNASIAFDNWPFNFSLASTYWSSCNIGSNGYATFGSSYTNNTGLGPGVPNSPKIMFGAGDVSWQRVYTQKSIHFARFRWEGHSTASGVSPGSSTRVIEITFWNRNRLIEVRTGDWGSASTLMLASSSTSYASSSSLGANQSWVFEGNAAGTSWTLYGSNYVNFSET